MTVAGVMKTHPRFKQSSCNRKYEFNPFNAISTLKGVVHFYSNSNGIFHAPIQMGGGQGIHPLENYKAIRFLSNTSPHPLENDKDSKPKFNVGPL